MNYKIFIILVLLLLCAQPVAANIAYSEDYYTLQEKSNSYISYVENIIYEFKDRNSMTDAHVGIASFYELRRQTILMEKQNELQAELIKAQWVETCYTLDINAHMGNRSAWKSECANAGYQVG